MIKIHTITLITLCLFLSGCKSFGGLIKSKHDALVYSEPSQSTEQLARIRFVGNVTGTSLVQKSDTVKKDHYLVPHTMLGFYNETRDIGMPKISYRPQDYKGYYFEIRVKPEPTYVNIMTDYGSYGRCSTTFLINPEPGKDYDFNYDQNENNRICIPHFNEIVKDPTTGVTVLKPATFKSQRMTSVYNFD